METDIPSVTRRTKGWSGGLGGIPHATGGVFPWISRTGVLYGMSEEEIGTGDLELSWISIGGG